MLAWAVALALSLSVLSSPSVVTTAPTLTPTRDLGQWANVDPELRAWYRSLRQPDNQSLTCCGVADAYYADKITVINGKAYATITDDRDDGPLGRPHIPNGTIVEIPSHKMSRYTGNPTGHNIIFMSPSGLVHCFILGTGS